MPSVTSHYGSLLKPSKVCNLESPKRGYFCIMIVLHSRLQEYKLTESALFGRAVHIICPGCLLMHPYRWALHSRSDLIRSSTTSRLLNAYDPAMIAKSHLHIRDHAEDP